MEKLILRNRLSPGDVVMLTAAVRDLHRCHPGRFAVDVRTPCPALWEHNPHLTPLDEDDPTVRIVDCHYPLIHQSNQRPYHFIHGFIEHLNAVLDLRIQPSEFRGDLHLSEDERRRPSPVEERTGHAGPFWIVCPGGKHDYTVKWWDRRRYQQVVDHFSGRLTFVQVGETGHYHPPLRGVIDLRGRTTLRDLVRLVHHAGGVLCGVTLHMHLAAAVPLPTGTGSLHSRPAVIVAGGREPPHWEAYPTHQFLHTVGALPCCADGGCWKSRTLPLGDGDEKDHPDHLCVAVHRGLPRCMDLITADHVVRSIEVALGGADPS